jgi:hypothetical protein
MRPQSAIDPGLVRSDFDGCVYGAARKARAVDVDVELPGAERSGLAVRSDRGATCDRDHLC